MDAIEITTKIKHNEVVWKVIDGHKEPTLRKLQKKYRFHDLDIDDCLSATQRPKIDEYDDYLFLVLHIPELKGHGDKKRIINSEVKIFVGNNYLITLHNDNDTINSIVNKLRKRKKERERYMKFGTGYLLYMLVDDLFESGLPLIATLTAQVNELEAEVFDMEYAKDRLKDILQLKKDLINFRRIIMPQRAVVAQLEHKDQKFLPEKLEVYFDNIVDKIEKIWNNIENLQELTSSIQETNESIISHNTNNVIKMLTIISVIMLPLTVITGFYGMNVQGLWFAGEEFASIFVAGIVAFVAISMIVYFKYRNWL
ncbi:MAG: magnesium transporter CorA family protein [Candidatus Gracilibacteria bacterium]